MTAREQSAARQRAQSHRRHCGAIRTLQDAEDALEIASPHLPRQLKWRVDALVLEIRAEAARRHRELARLDVESES